MAIYLALSEVAEPQDLSIQEWEALGRVAAELTNVEIPDTYQKYAAAMWLDLRVAEALKQDPVLKGIPFFRYIVPVLPPKHVVEQLDSWRICLRLTTKTRTICTSPHSPTISEKTDSSPK